MLYIFLLFVVLFIGYAYIGARERVDKANIIQADRKAALIKKNFLAATDKIIYPSWVNDENTVQAFEAGIINNISKTKIPTTMVLQIMKDPRYKDEILTIAWAVEESRCSFEEQISFATDFFISMWNQIPYSEKRAIINQE